MNLKQERENACRKSIYVRGFQNSGSIEEELSKFFSVYGKVTNIFLDKDKVHVVIDHQFCNEYQIIFNFGTVELRREALC